MHQKMEYVAKQTFALLALTLLAPQVWAVNYCVDTSAELQSAITEAGNSSVSDEIRLETGTYVLGEVDAVIAGGLIIRGGYPDNCSGFGTVTTRSTISHNGSGGFELTSRNNITLDRLVFSGFTSTSLSDFASSFNGNLRVTRSRFINSVRGLRISSKRANVWVENSVFSGHASDGLRIATTSDGISGRELRVQFVTIAAPTSSASPTSGLLIDGRSAPFSDLRIYNTVLSGNPLDLRIFGQEALVQSSFWNTQDFQFGGGLDALSNRNRSGDPGINSVTPFRPIQPTSQLINNGQTPFGGSPTYDYDGDPRLVGDDPDIGAIESTVDNSATLVVTNTNDAGSGSLRDAIATGNTNPGFKKITFNIPGSCPLRINLSTSLPAITRPVAFEGYTQPGSSLNSERNEFDGVVCVFITGGNSIASGLRLQTQAATEVFSVRGMGFYGFSSEAIRASGPGRASIRGNWFGTGGGVIGQNFADAVIRVEDAPETLIGTSEPADMNVIGGGDIVGVDLLPSTLGKRSISGNLIGLGRDGSAALANGIGVRIDSGFNDTVRQNAFSHNTSHAITIGGTSLSTLIFDNDFGRTISAGTVGGNGGNAVRMLSGSRSRVRFNKFVRGSSDGVAVLSASRRNFIDSNNFSGTQRQAIDLAPDGVNPIDLDVDQTGANDQQNYPLINDAFGGEQAGEVVVTLSSANGVYDIQLFVNNDCFPSAGGFNQAQRYLGQIIAVSLTCATATANCDRIIRIPIDNSLLSGDRLSGSGITATATDEEGNTSEVSACRLYRTTAIFQNGFE